MKGSELEALIEGDKEGRTKKDFAKLFKMSRANLYLLFKEPVVPTKYIKMAKNLGLVQSMEETAKLVPVYDLDAAGSNITILNDSISEYISGYISAPEFNDCDASIGVWGNSMYPKYCAGEKVALKRITDWDVITFGEAHVFVTAERIILKYLRKGKDKDHWKLCSENSEEYEPFEIPKNKVINLYIVKGKITKNIM